MQNEIGVHSREDAFAIAKVLLDNDYVVMLSNEEELTIINYEWNEYGDRNGIIFMTEDQRWEECDKCRNHWEENNSNHEYKMEDYSDD